MVGQSEVMDKLIWSNLISIFNYCDFNVSIVACISISTSINWNKVVRSLILINLPTSKGWKPEFGRLFNDLNLRPPARSCVGEHKQPYRSGEIERDSKTWWTTTYRSGEVEISRYGGRLRWVLRVFWLIACRSKRELHDRSKGQTSSKGWWPK